MRRGGGFPWRRRSFRIGLESATILLQNSFRLATIFATIAPRLGHDRALIVVLVSSRPLSDPVATISRRNFHDRGSIGPRSWSSSTCLHSRLIALQVRGRSRSCDLIGCDRRERPPLAVRSVQLAMEISTVR